ncbi:hypothetical protein DO97_09070 [Neosynechococcus sphagnicola sy1]|uniref:Uncharacterized protein n=1 Tax=Neosynechococcus sphagnicola sy1 TaxID=1497020 RepID=A0A098TKM0_9CYAN|nr:hypothetical protein DO97_09070 [Neosynechococcus sphagnicola sy1]
MEPGRRTKYYKKLRRFLLDYCKIRVKAAYASEGQLPFSLRGKRLPLGNGSQSETHQSAVVSPADVTVTQNSKHLCNSQHQEGIVDEQWQSENLRVIAGIKLG